MSSKESLATTTDKIFKEEMNEMVKKTNVVKKAITTPFSKNNINTVNKTEKLQASKRKKINPSAINQTKVNNWIN